MTIQGLSASTVAAPRLWTQANRPLNASRSQAIEELLLAPIA
ncbi:MAG: hypothetical protein R3D66_04525 [Alphaproteobacteria bacterium]